MIKLCMIIGSIFFVATSAFFGAGFINAQNSENAALREAIQVLKVETAKLGAPKLEGMSLFFGTTKMNGNYEIVDKVKSTHSCTATLFVKKGENFIRISTNVLKEGNRAVGTPLDPNGKAYAAIVKAESFAGVVDILGAPYNTIYEPIKDESGQVVGVYYVGIPVAG